MLNIWFVKWHHTAISFIFKNCSTHWQGSIIKLNEIFIIEVFGWRFINSNKTGGCVVYSTIEWRGYKIHVKVDRNKWPWNNINLMKLSCDTQISHHIRTSTQIFDWDFSYLDICYIFLPFIEVKSDFNFRLKWQIFSQFVDKFHTT